METEGVFVNNNPKYHWHCDVCNWDSETDERQHVFNCFVFYPYGLKPRPANSKTEEATDDSGAEASSEEGSR